MNRKFGNNDGYSEMVTNQLYTCWVEKIWELDDEMRNKTTKELVEYLKNVRFTGTVGLYIRRYIRGKFTEKDVYQYTFQDGRVCQLGDYMHEGYDIGKDEVAEYVDIWEDLRKRQNPNMKFPKSEMRRLLTMSGVCKRSKMLDASFALHMDACDTHKMVTEVLGEQSFNMRDPHEIIWYYCQTHPEKNTYEHFEHLCKHFDNLTVNNVQLHPTKVNHSQIVRTVTEKIVEDEKSLMDFLVANREEFTCQSETAYQEYMFLLNQAMKYTTYYNVDKKRYESVQNTEQLAKVILSGIPRATYEYIRKGKKVTEGDFVRFENWDVDQSNGTVTYTILPVEITKKMLKSDRLNDLRDRKIKPEKRDIVFLSFYLLSLQTQTRVFTENEREAFIAECNDRLLRCGMCPLTPANRLDNLILLTLYSEDPFELYSDFLESTFFNEPKAS